MAANTKTASLSMGPVLFNWAPEKWRDFFFRVADEADVETAYVGEVVCSKRSVFFEPMYEEVAERLQKGGKKVIFSTIAEIMLPRERQQIAELCTMKDATIEANDATSLYHLRGKPHRVGMFVNVYNEETMRLLAAKGASHFTFPAETPGEALAVLAKEAKKLKVTTEVMVYGRMPLALSARCYHARAHGRVKDNCQFICNENADGMELTTVDQQKFLVVNGIQTLSHPYLNLAAEMGEMVKRGIDSFRLSPHSHDMVKVAALYRALLDGKMDAQEVTAKLAKMTPGVAMANGFYHHKPGIEWFEAASA